MAGDRGSLVRIRAVCWQGCACFNLFLSPGQSRCSLQLALLWQEWQIFVRLGCTKRGLKRLKWSEKNRFHWKTSGIRTRKRADDANAAIRLFFIQSHAVTWHRFKTHAFQIEDVICVAVPLSEMRNAFVLNRSCVNYMLLLNAHRGFITYIAELNKCVSGLTLINPVHRLLRCHGKHCWQTGNVEAIFFFSEKSCI